ncbi:MAG: transcriptional regulator TrmB [Parcubacteria group bacterium Gr01-1014_18]|nr:MAG: transcriptional regulator TrmB [Parcubacteria group bacterium Greene0416_36]TSC81094.1 MAG: transcriptional regulator TrmB [Parcubacteria group bacterium Gr01-1014_18]TSC98490.1 MAG: transcriptional regulator TrmB [Parcubacteria group bacterium Greene1014_20]TSD07345.1 MAG: transcriptional regulator TrmB [Parcubacteria group bacterium Greene0714_2]
MDLFPTLKKFDFSDNEINVYLALLRLGPSPVRKIAEESKVNRGTTYDILKSLIEQRLITYYHKEKHQYFTAENPKNLSLVLEEKRKKLDLLGNQMNDLIPELESLANESGKKPVVKFYEGAHGGKIILEDLLESCQKQGNLSYAAYSSEPVAQTLYEKFPNFTEKRIQNNISVRVISLWQGGTSAKLASRKYLPTDKQSKDPNFVLIYADKVAFFSVNAAGELIAVLVEDRAIFQTQMIIFEQIWKTLP